eukprot:scaffold64786_cov66-Phaeocystis_antarctica.AAC.4
MKVEQARLSARISAVSPRLAFWASEMAYSSCFSDGAPPIAPPAAPGTPPFCKASCWSMNSLHTTMFTCASGGSATPDPSASFSAKASCFVEGDILPRQSSIKVLHTVRSVCASGGMAVAVCSASDCAYSNCFSEGGCAPKDWSNCAIGVVHKRARRAQGRGGVRTMSRGRRRSARMLGGLLAHEKVG